MLINTNLEERRRAVADAQEDALTRVQFLKVDLEQKVENARQLLITLTQIRDVRSDDPATCAARLTELIKLHPSYSGIGLAEANGDILCSTVAPPRLLNAIQEKHAWFQRALETRDFSVGDYQVGPQTGQAILTFGYPLLDSQNQVLGIVFAAIRLAAFNQLASETQYPEQTALIAIDRNGTILDGYPQPEAWVGKTLPEAPLVRSILTQRQGVAEVAGVDGVTRLYAFAPVRNVIETGIYVGAGIPTDVVFAEADETLLRNLLALGLIAALALAAALFFANAFILRHVKGLVGATQHLRRGDLSARSEAVSATAELDELALAFNEMAAALEQREAQRRQAENTLREQREVLQVTLSSIGDAVIATDAQGDVTFMNPIAEAFTGWTQAEAAGKSLDTIFRIINEDTRQAAENPATRVLREDASIGLANHTLLVTRHGDERAIDDSAAPIRNAAGDLVGVVLVFRDVSERRSAERRLLIQYLVTRILAESDSLEKVATKVLQAICEWIGWQAGTLWRVDRSANVLRHERTWQAPALPVTDLETVNRESTFPPECDLPGRAWAKGQPLWLPDIGEDAQFTRAGAAVKTGLHAALALPLRSRSQVVGVLECLSDKRQEPDEDLLTMLEALGNQIGNFIERKEAEEALKQAEQAQRLLAEAGRLLTASLDDETRLANVAKLLVAALADWCAIDLIEDDQSARRLAVAHVDPTKVALAEDMHRRYPPDWNAPVGVPQVLRSGQSEFFPEVTDELLQASVHEVERLKVLRELGLKSAIIVPMIAHGRTFGAMTLVWSESGR
ncbi:MAG TPA: GAF domain-containing protein, partial [Anaerolineae bacterium]|nr:GAF domain-containing protein [Anaerolineae bacterium]